MKKYYCLSLMLMISLCASSQRNVILMIADDLSPDYFGFYENHVDTVDVPHIRAMLNKGVRFKNLMSNPVCSSTRTTILTGRYSFRTGVGGIVGSSSGQIDTSEKTIPRLLKLHNPQLSTANIGKWHLSQPNPPINLTFPNVMGYDLFQGPFIGAISSYTNWTKYTNGMPATVTHYATSENVDDALLWIQTQAGHPFFLWLAFNAPHDPLHLPPAGLHSYTTLSGTPADINAHPKNYFKAMIQALDHEMGRLFDSLQSMNRLDSTDIIFIGDNGNTPRTAQITDTGRAKGTIYQYGVHVPLIVSGPSVVNPGRVSDALINTADIFSTVLELFGDTNWTSQIPLSKPVDSKSMIPIIKDQAASIRPWSFCEIFKLATDADDGKAIRNNEYKLLRFNNGTEEFYNLTLDPLEHANLLNGTLSATDITNYYYLCNEMINLIGTGSFCTNGVNTNDVETLQEISVYPNPFNNHIYTNHSMMNVNVELSDCLGRIVYNGHQLAQQNFSSLSHGLYFLKLRDSLGNEQVIRLMKED